MGKYPATAVVSRSKESFLCMQNFSIFKYGNSTYVIASGYKGDPKRVRLQLLKYDSNNKVFSFKIVNGEPKVNIIEPCYGHGNSIEVITYKNTYYCLYVEQTIEKKAKYVACSKFTIADDKEKRYIKPGDIHPFNSVSRL